MDVFEKEGLRDDLLKNKPMTTLWIYERNEMKQKRFTIQISRPEMMKQPSEDDRRPCCMVNIAHESMFFMSLVAEKSRWRFPETAQVGSNTGSWDAVIVFSLSSPFFIGGALSL